MKITEAYENRTQVEAACKKANACQGEYRELLTVETKLAFEQVLLRNFTWCVANGVLDEWLPDKLPEVKELRCVCCTGLKALPEMPKIQRLHCWGCTKLKKLPEMPEVKELWCSNCTSLTSLPEMPEVKKLWCWGCTGLTALPEKYRNELL